MSYLTDYNHNGYAVVDDFLPQEDALRLNAMYEGVQDWQQQDQVRESHYQHVFKTKADCFPREDEHYMAKFGRSRALEQSGEFMDIYTNTVMSGIERAISIRLRECDVRCYRLLPGDFYRTHIDDYAGDVGLIYYLNKRWVWDWGGILHVCHDDEEADKSITSVMPKFNRAVLINHKVFRFPHFISSVEPWAKEPRYTIIAFNRV